MAKNLKVLRGLGMCAIFALASSITAASIMEYYKDPIDQVWGTKSSTIVTDEVEKDENGNPISTEASWNFKSQFKTAKEAVEGYKAFAIKEARDTMALLKNNLTDGKAALPIAKDAKVTLFGIRSYAPVYGNSAGSIADWKTTKENQITKCFQDRGFKINPSMLETYQKRFEGEKFAGSGFGATPPEYSSITKTNTSSELTPDDLKALNPNYNKDYNEYNDAAIVILGRPGGESKNYFLGQQGLLEGVETDTGNIMGITKEEQAIIKEAKKCSSKVIVLINSTNVMEIQSLAKDDDIDAILWIGFPGAYGFLGVADVLNGTVSPSARLGDIYPTNGGTSPAMQNFGNDTPWTNDETDFVKGANVNTYLVEAEGIYQGYRYYETRYADCVNNVSNASNAKAGTYTTTGGKLASSNGTWNYNQEVVYPFGYGLSYTSFTQTLDSVSILGDKKQATVKVTIKNDGNVAGKDVVQLYAQTPYNGKVEKSAIQLMDFEKTKLLNPGESQQITMYVDMSNIASYDYKDAKTFIVNEGKYYFAIGKDSHDALNNILTAQNKTTANGMTNNGDSSKTYSWEWGYDKDTFSVSKNKTEITNRLSDGDYSMDLNSFMPNTVTYLSRSDWNNTFPKKYTGIKANDTLIKLLNNDFIELKNEDTSEYKWGVESELTLNDLKGADWNDERWQELVDKVTVREFLDFASNAFHHIQKIDSVGYLGNNADDGPGGADTHYFDEGQYQGKPYEDAKDYAKVEGEKSGYGTRVAPSQQNLGYGWDKELAYENGEIIIGETSLILNLPIIIGPGMNLHRHGYNGRGGEYYSEDPILSGYIGSNSVQGAQSKGCLVNIKHAAFNCQEINRSGIAVFMNEQKARELELRNLQQAFEGNGKPASFYNDSTKDNTFKTGAYGLMSSYNRIGAVASSANRGVMVDILRNEWGFKGYNVTDFTGVSLKAAPKESILAGTTAFCGFGSPNLSYWTKETELLSKDKDICAAIKQNIKYVLYSLANSNALNGINSSSHVVWLMTSWRAMYISFISISGVALLGLYGSYIVLSLRNKKEEE